MLAMKFLISLTYRYDHCFRNIFDQSISSELGYGLLLLLARQIPLMSFSAKESMAKIGVEFGKEKYGGGLVIAWNRNLLVNSHHSH